MKVISYNVNGIRSAINKGFNEWLRSENPDVLCLQELKASPEQIDLSVCDDMGYHVILNSAVKKGYSGVALLSKRVPDLYVVGMQMDIYDSEGRVIRADFGEITVICVYIPSGTTGDVRQTFKMEFLKDFMTYLKNLKKERNKILVCGDFNICHKSIDINHPERHKKSSGFLPEEREWFDNLINCGFIDTFREFDNTSEKYSWWSYMANSRSKNLGWRIDYHVITEALRPKLKNAYILSDVIHSDHCPVVAELDF